MELRMIGDEGRWVAKLVPQRPKESPIHSSRQNNYQKKDKCACTRQYASWIRVPEYFSFVNNCTPPRKIVSIRITKDIGSLEDHVTKVTRLPSNFCMINCKLSDWLLCFYQPIGWWTMEFKKIQKFTDWQSKKKNTVSMQNCYIPYTRRLLVTWDGLSSGPRWGRGCPSHHWARSSHSSPLPRWTPFTNSKILSHRSIRLQTYNTL